MRKYQVRFNANGKFGGAVIVDAPDRSSAGYVALAKIQGQYGYKDKKITIASIYEIRQSVL